VSTAARASKVLKGHNSKEYGQTQQSENEVALEHSWMVGIKEVINHVRIVWILMNIEIF
jgi:hypothetical protein